MKIVKVMLLMFAVSLGWGRDLEPQNTRKQPQLVYYKFFTPMKLIAEASFIHHHNSITPRLLTFLSAPSHLYRLMIVPLIPPGVIDADAKLVVKMAVALETKYGQGESDPSFAVSDSNRFIGVLTTDKLNYASYSPCRGIEGDSGLTITKRNADSPLPKPSESYYPGRFDIHLSLSDRWGTCFISHDGGFSREMIYQNKLNPENGLFLEIYGDDTNEKEGIKYIELTILQEN